MSACEGIDRVRNDEHLVDIQSELIDCSKRPALNADAGADFAETEVALSTLLGEADLRDGSIIKAG